MPTLTIAWEYLTGYAVATDPGNRERAEWPPHPARVFMAMAAAWFETEPGEEADADDRREHADEGQALRWLESLAEPELWLPPNGTEGERSLVTCYVPVNDKAGPSAAVLQSAPAITRTKQARTFPRRHVGSRPCALHWPAANGVEGHHEALARIAAKVTRIGHSSSLVRMWPVDPADVDELANLEYWHPSDELPEAHCRRIAPGLLDSLPEQTQIPRIERFAEAVWRIEDAQNAVQFANSAPASKAATKNLRKEKKAFKETFGEEYKKTKKSPFPPPPPRLRPRIGLWTGYRRNGGGSSSEAEHASLFDTDLLVLTPAGGHGLSLPITSTLEATKALRGSILKSVHETYCGCDRWKDVVPSTSETTECYAKIPAWISGHHIDGSRRESETGNLAILPLPDVGHQHADGHLLGMALAFPREGPGGDRRERGRALGPLLVDDAHGEPTPVELHGRFGTWTLCKRDWSESRRGLQPEAWTAHADGNTIWASVTPVVLDRFPKADRGKPDQRKAWEQEVRAILAEACTRIGLPAPIHIDVDTTAWHRGSPRAVTKRRRLRSRTTGDRSDATLGDGFPDYPAKGTRAPRPQVHVFLQFAEPVLGPVLLGAGRYRGYGMCKPWEATR